MKIKRTIKNYSRLLLVACALCSCQGPTSNNLFKKGSILEAGDLKENPLLLGAITTSVNLNNETMATLYGNKIAVDFAHRNLGVNYPEDARLYEVTWKQKPDSVWFGAKIPGKIISVEKIVFLDGGEPTYTLYKGKPLRKVRGYFDTQRLIRIISQDFAETP